ncbi:sodium channel modifier 1 isoform X2 [Engystomops pustulosus]|uniref:sodium channel modifier 1 isoform X2 n=1 Tax=Engystomops pustulosus TaxID=76066 RepID=UPI003AFA366E
MDSRYACTVCHHRPVFHTIDMLSVHRGGKKHVTCLQNFYKKKAAHRNEVQKRRHEEYVRAEEAGEQRPAPLLEQTRKITQHALLKSAPYNSCCTRKRAGEGRGKDSSSKAEDPPQSLSSPGTTQPDLPPTTAETTCPEPRSRSTGICKPSHTKKNGKKKKPSEMQEDVGDDPERRRVMEHYLSLRSSGWIPDGTGKWIKDENVEFDSDEEEPPALPPPP